MKRFLSIVFLLGPGIAAAADPGVPPGFHLPGRSPLPPKAWLGLQVSRPDESITAQLPSLPPGIGFVIRTIDEGGPAATAGLQEFDVVWKLGDQMLVNESQLAALLRLSKPGDEITLSGFRAGKALEVKLKLGEQPESKRPFPGDLADSAILPDECGGPMRVVNIAEKLASYTTDEGRAEVRKEGEVYKVKIEGPKAELIFGGVLPADENLDQIPKEWRRRVYALRRGLDHALNGRMVPTRQPRPRVVPPPAVKS